MDAIPETRGARRRAAVVWVLACAFVLAVAASFMPGPWAAAAGRVPWLPPALAVALFAAMLAWGRGLLQHEAARRQAVQAQLRGQQRFHREALDGMPHAVAVRDAQARLVFGNAAYVKLLGVPLQKALGTTMPEAVHHGENAGLARALHTRYLGLLADGTALNQDVDLRVAGQLRRVMHWASPIADRDDGHPAYLVCGVIDVTERHQLAQLIESARSKAEADSRAKSSYLASMSHEIRTPMNAVLGVLELLLREGRLAPADQHSVALAHSAARALLGLLDDALDLSKVEAGAMDLVARPTRLASLVREATEVFRGVAVERGLGLRVEIGEGLDGWHGVDGLRLRQIVGNLLANALRFTDQGEVVVRLASQGVAEGVASMLLEVSDTGIGMQPKEVLQLFRPFFQAESAGIRAQGGTGLGLAIAQGLCARMGGEIEVHSVAGGGTTIRVRLPMPVVGAPDDASAPDEAHAGQTQAVPARGRFNVLVVDDHPANRLLLQRQLGFLGYRTELSEDGQQALARWQAGGIDAVIADCSMPVMDGYVLAAQIRAIERRQQAGAHCPILGCTAHVREQDRRRALDAGMDECLAKPLGLDALLQALQRHLLEEPAAFDADSLGAVSGGDPQAEARFLQALLDANLDDLDALERLVRAGGPAPDIATLAHRIKGPARLVRARQVVRDCESLEAVAGAGQAGQLDAAFAALQASLTGFNAMISQRLQAGGSLAH